LYRRKQTGEGDYLDIGMQDAVLAGCLNILGPAIAEGRQPVAKHQRTTGGSALYRTYETRDRRFIALAGQEMKFVRLLLDALQLQDFIPLCERGPGPHQKPLIDALTARFLQHDLAHWEDLLQRLDICFGVVKTLPEALEDPNALAREMVWHDEAGVRHIGSPIRFRNEPARLNPRAPLLGADNQQLIK
jgi:crotonobetainyl-CoA:carnitine CoA-transferase CaiB-like acyl-CoA transferase